MRANIGHPGERRLLAPLEERLCLRGFSQRLPHPLHILKRPEATRAFFAEGGDRPLLKSLEDAGKL
jgi:hypothetical protein